MALRPRGYAELPQRSGEDQLEGPSADEKVILTVYYDTDAWINHSLA